MRNTYRQLLALPVVVLLACNQENAPISPNGEDGQKEGLAPRKDKASLPFDMSLISPEELEKIKPGSGDAYRRPAPPLKKTSAVGTVGFLTRHMSTMCHGEKLSITMDDEEDGNGTEVKYNPPEAPGFWVDVDGKSGAWTSPGGVDTKFEFCRTDRTYLKQIRHDYVVLRLSESCPTNGHPFARIIDNEDNNNHNSFTGNIWPSTMTASPNHGWTRLELCFVPSTENDPCALTGKCWTDPTFEEAWSFEGSYGPGTVYSYGAFVSEYDNGNEPWPLLSYRRLKGLSDDEDNNNINGWDWYGMSADFQNRVRNIIRETPHTTYYFVRTSL